MQDGIKWYFIEHICGSVDKATDSQPQSPQSESTGSGSSALGQGTLSSLPSLLKRPQDSFGRFVKKKKKKKKKKNRSSESGPYHQETPLIPPAIVWNDML